MRGHHVCDEEVLLLGISIIDAKVCSRGIVGSQKGRGDITWSVEDDYAKGPVVFSLVRTQSPSSHSGRITP